MKVVYIAGNVVDAQKVERVLTEAGIDYGLSLEPFRTTSLLSGEYLGLFVSVPTMEHERCRNLLQAAGLLDTVG